MSLHNHIFNLFPSLDVNRQFMFFSNHKVAQTSINRGLLKDRVILVKGNFKEYKNIFDSYTMDFIVKDIFKFTIVRNPWSKVVSAFHYLKRTKIINNTMTFNKFVNNILVKYIDGPQRKLLFFHEFNKLESHFDIQFHKAYFNGNKFVDFVGRLENIKKDWKYISSMINCPFELPHKNKTNHTNYRDYYNKKIEILWLRFIKRILSILTMYFKKNNRRNLLWYTGSLGSQVQVKLF